MEGSWTFTPEEDWGIPQNLKQRKCEIKRAWGSFAWARICKRIPSWTSISWYITWSESHIRKTPIYSPKKVDFPRVKKRVNRTMFPIHPPSSHSLLILKLKPEMTVALWYPTLTTQAPSRQRDPQNTETKYQCLWGRLECFLKLRRLIQALYGATDPDRQCPLHNKPHALRKCRTFRSKLMEEQKTYLKEDHLLQVRIRYHHSMKMLRS